MSEKRCSVYAVKGFTQKMRDIAEERGVLLLDFGK
jgi:glutamate-1-semialdehyde aminotransferase